LSKRYSINLLLIKKDFLGFLNKNALADSSDLSVLSKKSVCDESGLLWESQFVTNVDGFGQLKPGLTLL
jgi:hypothetical protein